MPADYQGRVLCFGPDELAEIGPLFPGMQMHRSRREVEPLAADIGAHGLLEPGCVFWQEGQPQLVFGCRRLAAIKLWNEANPTHQIDFWAWEWTGSYEDAIAACLSENSDALRKHDPIDKAHELRFLTAECGHTKVGAAKLIGECGSRAYQLLMIFDDMDEQIIEQMENGRLGDTSARKLSKLSKRSRAALIKRFANGEIDSVELGRLADQERLGRSEPPPSVSDRDLIRYLIALPNLGAIIEGIKSGTVRISALDRIDRGIPGALVASVWEHERIDDRRAA
jgi:hypothetical protein